MKMKERVAVLEAKTMPQRWAARLMQVDKGDTVQMEILLDLAASGLLLPIPAQIEGDFRQRVNEWRADAPEENGFTDAQNNVLIAALAWLIYFDTPAEFRKDEEIFIDVAFIYLDEAVPGFEDLPKAEAQRVASAVAARLNAECAKVKPVDIPQSDAARILDSCLDMVRDAVTVARLEAVL